MYYICTYSGTHVNTISRVNTIIVLGLIVNSKPWVIFRRGLSWLSCFVMMLVMNVTQEHKMCVLILSTTSV